MTEQHHAGLPEEAAAAKAQARFDHFLTVAFRIITAPCSPWIDEKTGKPVTKTERLVDEAAILARMLMAVKP